MCTATNTVSTSAVKLTCWLEYFSKYEGKKGKYDKDECLTFGWSDFRRAFSQSDQVSSDVMLVSILGGLHWLCIPASEQSARLVGRWTDKNHSVPTGSLRRSMLFGVFFMIFLQFFVSVFAWKYSGGIVRLDVLIFIPPNYPPRLNNHFSVVPWLNIIIFMLNHIIIFMLNLWCLCANNKLAYNILQFLCCSFRNSFMLPSLSLSSRFLFQKVQGCWSSIIMCLSKLCLVYINLAKFSDY